MQKTNGQVLTTTTVTLEKLTTAMLDPSFESFTYSFTGSANLAGTEVVITTNSLNPTVMAPDPSPNPDPLLQIARVQELSLSLPSVVESTSTVMSYVPLVDFQYYEAKDLLYVSYVSTEAMQVSSLQSEIAIRDSTFPPPNGAPGSDPLSACFKVASMEFTRLAGSTFEIKASFMVSDGDNFQAIDAMVYPYMNQNVLVFFVEPSTSYNAQIDYGYTSSIIVDFSLNNNALVPFVIAMGPSTSAPDWAQITTKKGMIKFV